MEEKKIIDPTGAVLFPGSPEFCEGNGKHEGYECCCDNCDYYLECFPDDTEEEDWYYTLVRHKCKRCGFVIERRYANADAYGGGMVTCTCGAFQFDPHPLWPRIGWREGVDPNADLEEYVETAVVKALAEEK